MGRREIIVSLDLHDELSKATLPVCATQGGVLDISCQLIRLTSLEKKAIIAIKAVLIPQEGCQLSGWKDEMDRQIFLLVSNLPDGVYNENAKSISNNSYRFNIETELLLLLTIM